MQLELSERDLAVLGAVGRYRLITSGQIERLLFAGHHASPVATRRRCQSVLHRLVDGEYLDRLERRQGGHRAGSTGFTYRLTSRGRRAIGEAGRGGRREPTDRFTGHTIACAEVAVRLYEARRAGIARSLTVTSEPDTWKGFIGRHGQREILKPDLLVEIVTETRMELRWFVEVDRATEHLPTILRKCQQYQAYWRAGAEPHPVFPRVLWSVPDHRRAARISRLLDGATGFEPGLFVVATDDDTTAVLTGTAHINQSKGGES
jgi:hypothetical protein